MKLTDLSPENSLDMLALNFSATYNFTNYIGVSGGWKYNKTKLQIDSRSRRTELLGTVARGSLSVLTLKVRGQKSEVRGNYRTYF